jgi:hypothetical protein
LGSRLINRFKAALIHPEFLEAVHFNNPGGVCLDQYHARYETYHHLVVKHDLMMQTGRGRNINPSEVRFICEMELDHLTHTFFTSVDRLAWLMDQFERPCTRRALAMTTDAEIASVHKFVSKMVAKDMYVAKSTVPIRMCGCCGFCEELGTSKLPRMKRCGSCLIEYYCSSECQRTAWPDHKFICNPLVAQNAQT